jgi:hypothetical protein
VALVRNRSVNAKTIIAVNRTPASFPLRSDPFGEGGEGTLLLPHSPEGRGEEFAVRVNLRCFTIAGFKVWFVDITGEQFSNL